MSCEAVRMGRYQRVIADTVAKELELPLRTGRKFLERVIELVADDLVNTGRIELRGLGTFRLQLRKGRQTVHPVTRNPVVIADKKMVVYRSSLALRRRLVATPPAADPKPQT